MWDACLVDGASIWCVVGPIHAKWRESDGLGELGLQTGARRGIPDIPAKLLLAKGIVYHLS